MKTELIRRLSTRILFVLLVSMTALLLWGCPDDPKPPVETYWKLEMRSDSVLYRDAASGHVPNDTIIVRVFNPLGEWSGSVLVKAQAAVSRDSVTQTTTTYGDTTTHWWGSYPPLIYWGSGDTVNRDTIFGWAVVDTDTVATGYVSFEIRNP